MKVFFKGDRCEYTGKTVKLYGGVFYEVRLIEGHLKGETRLVKEPKNDINQVKSNWNSLGIAH